MMTSLHQQLIDRQSTEELLRKALKARTKHYWTQEDLDYADRYATLLTEWLNMRVVGEDDGIGTVLTQHAIDVVSRHLRIELRRLSSCPVSDEQPKAAGGGVYL